MQPKVKKLVIEILTINLDVTMDGLGFAIESKDEAEIQVCFKRADEAKLALLHSMAIKES